MALEDVRLELEFFDDPRTRRAARLLGPLGPLYVIKLRIFAARFSPTTGDLSGFTEEELGAAAGYSRDPAKLLAALRECDWLVTGSRPGGYAMADWSRLQPHAVVSEALRDKRVKAAKTRWLKEKGDARASNDPHPTNERTDVPTNERTDGPSSSSGEEEENALPMEVVSAAREHVQRPLSADEASALASVLRIRGMTTEHVVDAIKATPRELPLTASCTHARSRPIGEAKVWGRSKTPVVDHAFRQLLERVGSDPGAGLPLPPSHEEEEP